VDSAHVDYRGLLEDAGFAVEIYEEPPGWRSQQRALAEGIIAVEDEVTHEMGPHYPAMARVFLAALPTARYVLAAARRLPSREEICSEVPTVSTQSALKRLRTHLGG
jgi:hypothetical protein